MMLIVPYTVLVSGQVLEKILVAYIRHGGACEKYVLDKMHRRIEDSSSYAAK